METQLLGKTAETFAIAGHVAAGEFYDPMSAFRGDPFDLERSITHREPGGEGPGHYRWRQGPVVVAAAIGAGVPNGQGMPDLAVDIQPVGGPIGIRTEINVLVVPSFNVVEGNGVGLIAVRGQEDDAGYGREQYPL